MKPQARWHYRDPAVGSPIPNQLVAYMGTGWVSSPTFQLLFLLVPPSAVRCLTDSAQDHFVLLLPLRRCCVCSVWGKSGSLQQNSILKCSAEACSCYRLPRLCCVCYNPLQLWPTLPCQAALWALLCVSSSNTSSASPCKCPLATHGLYYFPLPSHTDVARSCGNICAVSYSLNGTIWQEGALDSVCVGGSPLLCSP